MTAYNVSRTFWSLILAFPVRNPLSQKKKTLVSELGKTSLIGHPSSLFRLIEGRFVNPVIAKIQERGS